MRFHLSITNRLYLVMGAMACLLAVELATLRFAMRTLSAVRAFVEGESSWSKAQKNAALSMERYAATRREADYREFLELLKVPDGDHAARVELMKSNPNLDVVRQGFLAGHIHPDDITPIIELLQRFSGISYLERALHQWELGDALIVQFRQTGEEWHRLLDPNADPERLQGTMDAFQRLNEQLTLVEDEFSRVLGEGSRWLEGVIVFLLVIAVLTVETVGISLTLLTTRELTRGLARVQRAAIDIGSGDFSTRLPVISDDEIGALSESINNMGSLLDLSYNELEHRVEERTAELARLASENAHLYREAAEAVKAREEFFSIASHELRTPLTALHLHHQLLQKAMESLNLTDLQRTRLERHVAACVRQTARLVTLSSNLLDLTKVRLGRLELNRSQCDLAALARDAAEQVADDAARASVVLDLQLCEGLTGQFDATRVTQLMVNLLTNAIKYGEGKPVELRVEPGPSGYARIQVRDHGHGIAAGDQERVFQRFERAEGDAHIPGLGLGLYVARQIALAHDGRISVISRAGEGSTFTVDLSLTASLGAALSMGNESAPA